VSKATSSAPYLSSFGIYLTERSHNQVSLHPSLVSPDNVAVTLLPTFPTSLLITIMRIFDVYEHPSFEVEQADKTAVRSTIRRLGVGVGVGATVSAIAAISFWYCWLDPSPPSFLLSNTAITHLRWTGFNWSVLSSTGPTSIRGTYHYVLQRGGL